MAHQLRSGSDVFVVEGPDDRGFINAIYTYRATTQQAADLATRQDKLFRATLASLRLSISKDRVLVYEEASAAKVVFSTTLDHSAKYAELDSLAGTLLEQNKYI